MANFHIYVRGCIFSVEAEVTAYIPARTSGLPENCSPAEGGEVEIESVCVLGNDTDVLDLLQDVVVDEIREAIAVLAPQLAEEYACQAAEDRAEQRAMDREDERGYEP